EEWAGAHSFAQMAASERRHENRVRIYTITQWFLFFYIYSFIGWIWESAYVSILQKRLVNRGFLKGPLLPIYESGALCVLAAVLPVWWDPVKTFFVGMAAATVLEYITGDVMERIFRVRY